MTFASLVRSLAAVLPCVLALAPAQDRPAQDLAVRKGALLRKALRTMADLDAVAFSCTQDTKQKQRMPVPPARAGGGQGAIAVTGRLAGGMLAAEIGDQQVVRYGRVQIVGDGTHFELRRDRDLAGEMLPVIPDPVLLFRLLDRADLEVKRADVGEFQGRPVEILTVDLPQALALQLAWSGLVPDVTEARMGFSVIRIAGIGNARALPQVSGHAAFTIDPITGYVQRVRFHFYHDPAANVGVGRAIVQINGIQPAPDPELEELAELQEGEVLWRDGLPLRRLGDNEIRLEFDVAFSEHGTAKPPKLDADALRLIDVR
ncbi:MAG: hypothetical protein IPM29_03675 [Planctomycetes bacterium]|nr:hypothetical protein [Planctomycetota bacterium]